MLRLLTIYKSRNFYLIPLYAGSLSVHCSAKLVTGVLCGNLLWCELAWLLAELGLLGIKPEWAPPAIYPANA